MLLDIITILKIERMTTMFKIKMFLSKWQTTIGLLVIVALIGYIAYTEANKRGMLNKPVEVAQVEKVVKAEPITPKCTKNEVEYILKNEDNLLKNKEFVVFDLSTFKVEKILKRGDKVYTYYSLHGKEDVYITIAKEVSVDNNNSGN